MNAVYSLAEGILQLDLDGEAQQIQHSEALERQGKSGRLLLHEGELRVLMIALTPGIAMPEHAVEGPALVQVLSGDLAVRAGDHSWVLGPGGLLSIAPGLEHSAETSGGCVILVVVQSAEEPRLFDSRRT